MTLIDALDADYPDTIDLGLLCPVCDKPVFLVKKSERLRQGRMEIIQTHFSHYKSDSETAKLCEARIQTKEGREFLQHLSAESRGQRLSLFNRRLWEMIAWEKDCPRNLDKWLKASYPKHHQDLFYLVDHCWEYWKKPQELKQIKQAMPAVAEQLHDNREIIQAGLNPGSPAMQQAIKVCEDTFNLRLHWLIAEEVADYLAQSSAKKVFANLVRLALFDFLPSAVAENRPIRSNEIQYLILNTIGLTRWVAALEEFRSPRPGDGFGRK